MSLIYETGKYLEATGNTWHSEDSPWKATQILSVITDNNIIPKKIVEVGCGAGQILVELSKQKYLKDCQFYGYDISPQAIELCPKNSRNCYFKQQNFLSEESEKNHKFDVLLIIDVFEHVLDYMGFVEQCRSRARYKIFHIPLDIHVSSVARNSFFNTRHSVGHLHYFNADTALATLKDTGHEILDYCYTSGSFGVFSQHPSIKTAIANVPRWLFSKFSIPLSARIFGGYSLLVLTK
jgi:SAM-dependent methyltransferase